MAKTVSVDMYVVWDQTNADNRVLLGFVRMTRAQFPGPRLLPKNTDGKVFLFHDNGHPVEVCLHQRILSQDPLPSHHVQSLGSEIWMKRLDAPFIV